MTSAPEDIERPDTGVRASIIAEVVRLGIAQGTSPLCLLDVVGEIPGQNGLVSYAKANGAWLVLGEDRPHQPHGLLLGAASSATYGALVAVTKPAKTAREALRIMIKLMSAFTTEGSLSLHEDAQGTRLELVHRNDVEEIGSPVEFSLGLFVRLVGGADVVRRASFQHRPLGDQIYYERHLGSDVRYEASANSILFYDEALDRANPPHEPRVDFHRRLEGLLPSPVAPATTQARIEAAVTRATRQGRFDLASTARELGLSPRTLQRHAKQAGLELRAMLRAARRTHAIALLSDRSLSLIEIAERLDYSDERSFSRAFERWMGLTPARWRRLHR